MKRAVLVTGHYWGSRRKAGFHWIADSLMRQGWDVLFVTTALSWFSVLRRDYRLSYPVRTEAGHLTRKEDHLTSYVWFTRWHPANLRWGLLNRLTHRVFATYGELPCRDLDTWVAESDLVILESTAGLMLFERFRTLNPRARFVYRVSDDLSFMKCHPAVIDYESKYACEFDLVSVPSAALAQKFKGLRHVRIQHHGIEKSVYDTPTPNPYPTSGTQALFVGTSHVDHDFLRRAGRLRPHWTFHLVGPVQPPARLDNFVAHGEVPFHETVPYIQHADIGLQSLSFRPGAESFSDSLKVIQYTYCRLPIVAPDFMVSSRSHVFYYTPGDDSSIERALQGAERCDRARIDTTSVRSWDEVVSEMIALA